MLSDFQLARLIRLSYGFAGDDRAPIWDAFNAGTDAAGVHWCAHVADGIVNVLFPGTENWRDLFRDVEAIPAQSPIGFVHPGFAKGIAATLDAILAIAKARPIVVAGHSMGAAHATLFTAGCVKHGVRPLRRVVFGEPLSCFEEGAALARQISGVSFVAKDAAMSDPVPSLPPAIGYARATPLRSLRVTESAAAVADLGPLWRHSIISYASALDPHTP